jgi:hypothetical protein
MIGTGLSLFVVSRSTREFILAKSESTLKKKYFVYCFGQQFKVTTMMDRSIVIAPDYLVFMGPSSSSLPVSRSRRILELFRTTSRKSSSTDAISTNRRFIKGDRQRQRTTNTEEIPNQHVWRTAFVMVDAPVDRRSLN